MESTRLFQSDARSTSLDGLWDVVTDGALIQGLRRIADLAKIGVLGALLGALVSIVLVYVLGDAGGDGRQRRSHVGGGDSLRR